MSRNVTAEPYTAKHCRTCDTWVYIADGPFAEDGDRTKPMADLDHVARRHPELVHEDVNPSSGVIVESFPYLPYNEVTVQAVKEDPADA